MRTAVVERIRNHHERSASGMLNKYGYDSQSGVFHERRYVLARNIAATIALPVAHGLAVSEDAGENGQPKEETMGYYLYDCTTKLAHVGAPMVQ